MKKKKHIVKFWHCNPAVGELYPPILGKHNTMDWVKTERAYRDSLTDENDIGFPNVLKCPGIFELWNRGFFVQQPYDIHFFKEKDDPKINWEHPRFENFQKTDITNLESFQIQVHAKEVEKNLIDFPYPINSLPYIANIKTGFRVLSDVPMLFIPVPYPDEITDWTASTGVLETNKSIEINIQTYFHNYLGGYKEWKIKAGTKVQFIIPLTHEPWELVVNELSDKDKLWVETFKLVQNRYTQLCKKQYLGRYSYLSASLKKKMNEGWKKLWD